MVSSTIMPSRRTMRRSAWDGDLRIVRHQHQGRTAGAIPLQQQIEHMGAVLGVEIARRFVGKNDGRLENEGASQGNALLLAARKLDGIVMHAIAEAYTAQQIGGCGAAVPRAVQLMRQQNVFERGESRYQLKGLEDEAQLSAAHLGQLVFRQAADLGAIDQDFALRRRIQARQEPQQRAFAAAGSAHDGHELPGGDQQIDVLEDLDRPAAVPNRLFQPTHFNH